MQSKHNLGQYFTTHNELKEHVFKFIHNNPSAILEPSIGQGDLISFIADKIPTVTFDMYEIDATISLLPSISAQKDNVVYGDFMAQHIIKTYTTIIGNPPYVRTKKGNLYIDFVKKCVDLLEDNGELIFIVPSDFLKLTSASKLLNSMMTTGTFTHIFHPHNEKMFENASIDVIVFRYCKNGSIEKKCWYNDKLLHITNSNGLITFGDKEDNDYNEKNQFQDYFDIYVGMVSGKEEVYKSNQLGNIDVLNGENCLDKYIYICNYPCENEQINAHLLRHKPVLIERKIRKMNETNWFEWGAPRNITAIQCNLGNPCIYVNTLTRKTTVAFVSTVNYFGGGLIMLTPKKTCNLNALVSYMNSNTFKENFMYSGRFKIGHRQISNYHFPASLLL